VHDLFTKHNDGEFLYVASRDTLKEAVQLAAELKVTWPHEYVIRDSRTSKITVIELEARPVSLVT